MFCSIIPWLVLGYGFGRCSDHNNCRCGRDKFDDHHDDFDHDDHHNCKKRRCCRRC